MFQKIGGFILYTALALVCIGSILVSAYFLILAFQSKNWTPTEAIVEKVEIESTKRNSKNGGYSKKTIVSYKYFMGQKEYLGGNVCLASFVERKDYAEIYDKINEARKIRIFVNPKDFNQSVVVNGFSFNIFLILYGTLFLNFIGFQFLFEKQSNYLRFRPIIGIGFFLIIIGVFFIFVSDKYIPKYNLAENIVILEYK